MILRIGLIVGLLLCSAVGLVMAIHGPQENRLSQMQRDLATQVKGLAELHSEMGPVQRGDWLSSHKEPGQTFKQYLSNSPVKITRKRDKLYVLPLGEFNQKQKQIVELSAEFLSLYFSCDTKVMDTLSLDDAIPEDARRVHPSWGVRQIQSLYVLNKVLPKRLPKDAVALIAFTTSDLYPDEKWNFVFGQASLKERVGVWSLFRNGDPETEFEKCLERTLKTATHETGHMFSIQHCIAYNCNMCGSNSLEESDRRPIYLCPECLPKVWWATKANPESRFKNLAEFCTRNGLLKYAGFYQQCESRLSKFSEPGNRK